MIELLDTVVLAVDLPEHNLRAGAVGAVVDVYTKPDQAYEVEFVDRDGRTTVLLPLRPDQIRSAGADDLRHYNESRKDD